MSDTIIAKSEVMAFAGNPLDRAPVLRRDADWLLAQEARDDARYLVFHKGNPLVKSGMAFPLREADLMSYLAHGPTEKRPASVFLGRQSYDPNIPFFAVDVSHCPPDIFAQDGAGFENLRNAAFSFDQTDLALLGQARWLLDWHRRHGFCARCGHETEIREGGMKRHCPACKAEHFPRTDPVAIVLPIHGENCLLGRSPHFPPGFFSALAGFVEAGETLEECAVRETHEEAGVQITDVTYQFSQPWPFPSSLMMGCKARALTTEIHLDKEELEDALWTSRQTVMAILNGDNDRGIFLPPPFTIAHQLLKQWVFDTA